MAIQFEVKRTINVPSQKAYKGLLDLEAANKWMQGLVRIKRLDEGPMKVGSQWKETRKMYGMEASEVFEVVELKENEKIVLYCDGAKGTTGKGEYLYTYTIDSTNGQSVITLNGEIKGLTGFAKLMSKLMVRTFEKASAKDLDALKNYLENR